MPTGPSRARTLRGLVVDWGGVLTSGLHEAMSAWAAADGVDYAGFRQVLAEWLGPVQGRVAERNPVYALERGELAVPHFEEQLAARLTTRSGQPVPATGLVARMFEHFVHAPDMTGLVRRARAAGLRTALLSNSWGNDYSCEGWTDLFDAVVLSGEVGMRKPEPEIFRHTARLLGLDPAECVFVDDLPGNVAGAVAVGMVGVHHIDYATTAAELEVLFDRPLAA